MYTNSGFPSQHLEHNNIEIQCSAQAVAVNKHTSIIGKKGDFKGGFNNIYILICVSFRYSSYTPYIFS